MVLAAEMKSVSSADALHLIMEHLKSVVPKGLMPDPNVSFIEMGLDSLLMASLELYLQKHFDIGTGFLVQHKTPKECAEKLGSFPKKLSVHVIQKSKSTQIYPLSQAQKRLLVSASKQSPFEEIQIKVPQLDFQQFSDAWQIISKRHSILRTSLSLNAQTILDEPLKINAQNKTDVLQSPLRIQLVNEDTIKLGYHHALVDGSSMDLLMGELRAAYEDLESFEKSPNPSQYYEYCLFEEKYLHENSKKWPEIIAYWKEELKGFKEVFEDCSYTKNSSVIEWRFDKERSQKLASLAAQNQLTVFNLMTGLIRVLFYKLYDSDDLILGFPVEQRLHSDFEKTIGLFMNFCVCRQKLNPTLTLIQFIAEGAQKTTEAICHSQLPFNKLINRLQSSGILESEEQLLQLIIVDDKQTSEHQAVEVKTTGHSMLYPQVWYIQRGTNEKPVKLRVEFDTEKFSAECIREEIRCLERLCQKLLDNSNEHIQNIGLVEFVDLNPPHIHVDFLCCILNKLQELDPNKIVLKSHNQQFSVRQFLEAIWNLAENLKEIVQEEAFVALMLPRSPELILCLFGAWLNGYVVIPLDYQQDVPNTFKSLPPKTYIISDKNLDDVSNFILVGRVLNKRQETLEPKLPDFKPTDLCYCTFTSGSTGEPKLVMSERVGLSNLLRNYTKEFGYDEKSVVYQVVNPAFDIFLADVVSSFGNGATLLLAKHQIPNINEIEKHAATHAYIMPAYLSKMCSNKNMKVLAKLKILMFGGESVNENFVRKALSFNVPLVQLFGFTEHAVYTNFQWIKQPADCNLVGHPFEGTQVRVVDRDDQVKPDGFKGRLLSIGLGVCQGYFGVENSADFRSFNSHRAFLTGDICCKHPNGNIEFLGRKDEVIKLNGQKIYVGEVNHIMSKLESVQQAATISLKKGSQKLIVFVVSNSSTEKILSELRDTRPNWTLPVILRHIDSLPLSSNGKIDKQKLTLIAGQNEENEMSKGRIEVTFKNEDDMIEEIFRQFLGNDYKLEDDFLNAGIDSIQLLQVMQALEERLDIELDIRHAFKRDRCRNAREWLKTMKPKSIDINESPKEGPVTWNQEHVWLLRDLDPGHAESYRIKLKLDFTEKLDKDKFIVAIHRIVKEAESLRVSIQLDPQQNQLKQVVLPHRDDCFLLDTNSNLPISLHFESENTVRVEFDHSTVDGYSLRLIVDALSKYYTNPSISTKISSFSPIEFAKAQRTRDFTSEVEFFWAELADSINDVLPTELSRPIQVEQKAKHEKHKISTTNFDKLVDCKFNLFYLTLTAYLKQLSQETRRSSLVVAIPFANRSTNNANAVGYFSNALPIRFNLEGKDGKELVEYVQQNVLKTIPFSEIPFSLLVRQLKPERKPQTNPIFQRILMFEDFNVESVGNLFRVQEIDSDYAKFDQTWHAYRNNQNQLEIHVEYNQSLFTAEGVKKSLLKFESFFNQLVAEFSRIPAQIEWNDIVGKLFQFLKEELLHSNFNEDSNFFELGLHSLNAALLASRIRTDLGLDCSTKHIFEHQTINELVSMLKRQNSDHFREVPQSQLNDKFHEVSHLQATILRFMEDNEQRVLRDQYCNEFVINLDGIEDIEAKVFRMIREQEAFRTQFFIKENSFLLQVLDEQELTQKLPYCLESKDFQMETVFIDLHESNTLYIRLSHLVSDAHSMRIMMGYLNKDMPARFYSTSSEFNSKFNAKCKEDEKKNLEFWKSTFSKLSGPLFREHHVQIPTKSASYSLSLPKNIVIEELKRSKVSPNAFLLHKLAETLRHWLINEEDEIYIGVAKDMRSSFPDLDFSQTVGFFTQTLPIPCRHRTVNELNSLLFDVYNHSFISYEQLLELSTQSNLVETMLVLDFEDELDVKVKEPDQVNGKFPLTFHVKITRHDVKIQLVYWSELWSEETALSMLETFILTIKSETSNSTSTISSLYAQDLSQFVDPIERIRRVGEKSPDSIAIQSTTNCLTYRELCQKMRQISTAVKEKFSAIYGNLLLSDAVILVVGKNSIQVLVTCLAVMNSGAVYLPVDESLNSLIRIWQIYEETRPKFVISNENNFKLQNWMSFKELWSADSNETPRVDSPIEATNLAYLIYTSGTTGKQKAVQIERQSLWNTIQDASDFFDVTPSDCVYQFTKFCFDNSVLEIFVALCNGARLFVQEEEFDVHKFCNYIEEFKITHAFLYPGLVSTFITEELKSMCTLKCWIVGAEKLNKNLMDRALDLNINVIQNYGPTETTCYALRRRMQKGDDPQNLGKPIPGLTCRLSTENVPIMAAPRELLISGIGLMRGYVGDTSRQCFVELDGQRFYKTGDLCRQNRNEEFIFVGRTDNVVKIRGFRVDLNEVELVLLSFGQIEQVKVLADHESIYAYFVTDQEIKGNPIHKFNIAQLKSHCIAHLPRYAVPNVFCEVEAMPLTNNNKIDVNFLKTLKVKNATQEMLTEKQHQISKIWSTFFDRPVRIDESFFEIGGNSLSAQRMLNELERQFNVRLSISDLMMNPTIGEIEKLLTHTGHPPPIVEIKDERFPLSFQQEQMLFLEEVSEPDAYNLQFVQFFTKELDCERLFNALEDLTTKNDILKTKIIEIEGEFYQEIQPTSLERPKIEKISTKDLKQLIIASNQQKFNLFGEVPLRVRFFDVDDTRYCLFVEQHHLISDATSTMLIEEQISNSYNGVETLYSPITYAQWSTEQKLAKGRFEEMARELRSEMALITDAINLKQQLASLNHERIRKLEDTFEVDTIQSTAFAWLCTQLAQTFTEHFGQKTLIIGAPVQNRNEKTSKVLGNFLNNLVIPLNYDQNSTFTKNLKTNEMKIARSLRFSELPFCFVQQQHMDNVFDVYVNCRYSLENESALKMREKCIDILLDEYLPPKCHHLLEIDFDELEDGRFRVVWRTKSDNPLMNQLFDHFQHSVKAFHGNRDIKTTIRQAFQQTLPSNMKFADLDDYFVLGGNSLSFLRLYRLLKSRLDLHDLDATTLLTNCTVNSIYSKITKTHDENTIPKIGVNLICKGSGDTFIFFPTLFGGLLAYRYVFAEIQLKARDVSIVGVDVLEPTKFNSIDELAKHCALDLWVFIDENKLNTESVHFVGASFGALLAFESLYHIDKNLHGFRSLTSIDGIANSNQVNDSVTFEQHRDQTEQALSKFELDLQTRNKLVHNSWHLLQLANRHSINNSRLPHIHLFLLMITRQYSTTDYGWPNVGIQQRWVRIDGSHSSMMDDQRSGWLVERLLKSVGQKL